MNSIYYFYCDHDDDDGDDGDVGDGDVIPLLRSLHWAFFSYRMKSNCGPWHFELPPQSDCPRLSF